MSRTRKKAPQEPDPEGKPPSAEEESTTSTERKTRRRKRSSETSGPPEQRRATKAQPKEAGETSLPAALFYQGGPTLIFEVADQRYGLPVAEVIQIIEMVAITPLPAAPEIVAGVIDFHGRVIPVVEVRRRLGKQGPAYTLRTPIIIAQINGRTVGLIVDKVSGVVELQPGQIELSEKIFTAETAPPVQSLGGVARMSDGLLLILDLAAFLSLEKITDDVLSRQRTRR